MVDISKFLESEAKAEKSDPEKFKQERAEDARRAYKDYDRYTDEKLMNRYERMQEYKESKGSGTRGGGSGAGVDIEGLPKKLKPGPKNMKKGGSVKSKPKKMANGGSASKRADGCAVKGKTRGKFV